MITGKILDASIARSRDSTSVFIRVDLDEHVPNEEWPDFRRHLVYRLQQENAIVITTHRSPILPLEYADSSAPPADIPGEQGDDGPNGRENESDDGSDGRAEE